MIRSRTGFTGGTTKFPTYTNLGDHTETVEFEFDPKQTSYSDLLKMFWKFHDPTIKQKSQYKSVIFYHNEEQKKIAENSLKERQSLLNKPILTEIRPAEIFYNAEDYHQKYILRNHHSLFKSLNLEGEALIKSHVAARLNGYVGGYGSKEEFDREWKKMGITEEQAEYVLKQIQAGPIDH